MADRDCGDCQLWMYDEDTGRRKLDTRKRPISRGKVKPNCRKCPKQSPDNESRYRLSPKNRKAYEAWQRFGKNWPAGWEEDEMWVRNCQLIEDAHKFHEQNQALEEHNRWAVTLATFKQALG